MIYILYYQLAAALVIFLWIYPDRKSTAALKWKRFSTAMLGMWLVQIILFSIVLLYAHLFMEPGTKLTTTTTVLFILSVALAIWATRHIRNK